MTDKILKVGTFFSGIGSPEKALERLKNNGYINNYSLEFFSEINKNAVKSYCAVHNISENLNLGDIKKINGKELPYCDLWIGGFPCQDISCSGRMKGFDMYSATRSSLGWEILRILKEVYNKPKIIVFENVASITSKKFKNTLAMFKNELIDIGYTLYDKVLIASDYEIPQKRERYFLIAFLEKRDFEFPKPIKNSSHLKDFLDYNVDKKYYLTNRKSKKKANKLLFKDKNSDDYRYEIDLEKFKNGKLCGVDKKVKFNQSSRIFSERGYAPTLTASNTADNLKIAVIERKKMRIRKVTPKEAWRLMGFDESDFEKASNVCQSETALYNQAGNSIVVNVMYYLLKSLLKLDSMKN